MLGVIAIVGLAFKGRRVLIGALCLLIAALTWALMPVLVRLVGAKYDALQVTFVGTLVNSVDVNALAYRRAGGLQPAAHLVKHLVLRRDIDRLGLRDVECWSAADG